MSRYEDQLALVQQAIHQRNIAKMKAWAQEEKEVGQLLDKYSGKPSSGISGLDGLPGSSQLPGMSGLNQVNDLTKNFTNEANTSRAVSSFNSLVREITFGSAALAKTFTWTDLGYVRFGINKLPSLLTADDLSNFQRISLNLQNNLDKLDNVIDVISRTPEIFNKIVGKGLVKSLQSIEEAYRLLSPLYKDPSAASPEFIVSDIEQFASTIYSNATLKDASKVYDENLIGYRLDLVNAKKDAKFVEIQQGIKDKLIANKRRELFDLNQRQFLITEYELKRDPLGNISEEQAKEARLSATQKLQDYIQTKLNELEQQFTEISRNRAMVKIAKIIPEIEQSILPHAKQLAEKDRQDYLKNNGINPSDTELIKQYFPGHKDSNLRESLPRIINNRMSAIGQLFHKLINKLKPLATNLSERYGSGIYHRRGGSNIHSIHKQEPIKIINGNTEELFPKRYY